MRTRWFENTLGDERLRPVAHAVTPWASAQTLFSCASALRSRPGPQVSGRRPSGRALPGRGTARGAVAPRFAAQAGQAGCGWSARPGGRPEALLPSGVCVRSGVWVRSWAVRGWVAPRAFEAQVTGRVRAVSRLGDF